MCEDGVCPTRNGRGQLLPIELPELRKAEGQFYVTTRRGKQFNSMIYSAIDPNNGADRNDVLIHKDDAEELGIRNGEAVVVYNKHGIFHGRANYDATRRGNIQLYWPEGNVVIPKGVFERYAEIPEYNTAVIVEKADTFHAKKDTKYVERRIEDLEMEIS